MSVADIALVHQEKHWGIPLIAPLPTLLTDDSDNVEKSDPKVDSQVETYSYIKTVYLSRLSSPFILHSIRV